MIHATTGQSDMTNEDVLDIQAKLISGQPFAFRTSGRNLVIGVRTDEGEMIVFESVILAEHFALVTP